MATAVPDVSVVIPVFNGEANLVGLHAALREARDDGRVRVIAHEANAERNRVLGESIHDACCPMKVFRRSAAARWPVFDGYHRFLPAPDVVGTNREVTA